MAILRKNLNQYRKVYPGVRRTPRYEGAQSMEVGKLTFTNSDQETFIFNNVYQKVPAICASVKGDYGSVSVIVTFLNKEQAIITTSAKFTGEVHLHIVEPQ